MTWFAGIVSSFVSTAWAQAQAGASGQPASIFGNPLFLMLPIFLIFYFIMVRPQQKQQKERMKMISELKKGDPVVTTSGIYARVVGVTDKILTLEIADNTKVKVDREAVARLQPPANGSENNNK